MESLGRTPQPAVKATSLPPTPKTHLLFLMWSMMRSWSPRPMVPASVFWTSSKCRLPNALETSRKHA
eukprot:13225560-Alexandrium_andersonii.AAC.1